MNSTGRQLTSGVFYTALAKYSGIAVSLAVTGVLSRILTPDDFGIVTVATVIIAFFAIFSDLGVGPAIIQNRSLSAEDLGGIFTFTIWSGALAAAVFFAAAGPIARYYHSEILRDICRILSVNLFFATVNIVPNALLYKAKRFKFIAVRSLTVQAVCGAAAIGAAFAGAGIYALLINPVFSSIILFFVNFRQYPQHVARTWGLEPVRKIFAFSSFQFLFNVLNYFTRNLDKILVGRYMGLSPLGYYEKSYRLMMLPLQNITHVVTPVMHPVFAEYQNDAARLSADYLKVVRLLAFIGFPLSAFLCASAREITLVIFGPQWEASVPVFRILALSVGVQIVLSTSGSIFQAANSTRIMFLSGLLSSALNVAAIMTGIFVFRSLEAVAWCISVSFTVNFVQCYYLMYRRTFGLPWGPFWRTLLSPLLLTAVTALVLFASGALLGGMRLLPALVFKSAAAGLVWLAYIQVTGEYDFIARISARLRRVNNTP